MSDATPPKAIPDDVLGAAPAAAGHFVLAGSAGAHSATTVGFSMDAGSLESEAHHHREAQLLYPICLSAVQRTLLLRLVDPALLRPTDVKAKPKNADDETALASERESDAWTGYLANLAEAESLLDDLDTYRHPKTWWFNGSDLTTAETVSFEFSSNWMRSEHYPSRGFRGFLRGTEGKSMQARIKDPVGSGDGTVPTNSSSFNSKAPGSPSAPANRTFPKLEHQPAYEDNNVKAWATAAITAIAGLRFKELKG